MLKDQHPTDQLLIIKLVNLYIKLSKSETLDNQFLTPSLLKALKIVLANGIDQPANDDSSFDSDILLALDITSESYHLTLARLTVTQRLLLTSLKRRTPTDVQRTAELFQDYVTLMALLEERAVSAKFDRALHQSFADEFKSHLYFITAMMLLTDQNDDSSLYAFSTSDAQTNWSANSSILAVIGFLWSLSISKPNSPAFISKANPGVSSKKVDSPLINAFAVKCVARDSAWRFSVITNWLHFKLAPIKNKSNFYLKLSELSRDEEVSSMKFNPKPEVPS